ncbi:MAG: response regulator transcription factor [Eubacteriales bacterium]|nr:response regulator transcription factor [Eubacteriales bacterium]MDO5362572.1 response regulator transcription factor [Eubacteriales bacterium]
MSNILIIEDDENLAEALSDFLRESGYETYYSSSLSQTMKLLRTSDINLVILDVHLGSENGYALCREIRTAYDIPVLFLTGCSSESEIIQGFSSGGDDYVTKPFRIRELLARVQALLKRTVSSDSFLLKSGDIVYDKRSRQFSRCNLPLELTLTELRLACCLMEQALSTVTREHLFYQVWDKYNAYVDSNTLNVNISRLREKLGEWQGTPYIQTVRGLGYRWTVPLKK